MSRFGDDPWHKQVFPGGLPFACGLGADGLEPARRVSNEGLGWHRVTWEAVMMCWGVLLSWSLSCCLAGGRKGPSGDGRLWITVQPTAVEIQLPSTARHGACLWSGVRIL